MRNRLASALFRYPPLRARGSVREGAKTRSPRHAASLRRVALLAVCFSSSIFNGCAHQPVPPEHVGAPDRSTLDKLVDEVIERYRLPGIAVGVVYEGEILYTRTAGELVAGSGQRIDAREAHRIGLVDEVDEDIVDRTMAFAAVLAESAPLSIRGAKALLNHMASHDAPMSAEAVQSYVDEAARSWDYAEGRRAFAEKRSPRFRGS